MSNLFDSANYPEKEPTELMVGDRWAWKRTDLGVDYPPASYGLSYSLRLEASVGTEIEISASESGSDYLVEVAASDTADYTAGRYRWQAYITRSSDSARVTVDTGFVTLKSNHALDGADPRSHARKVLDAIESVLEGRASKDQEEYSINNRSLKRTPIDQLLSLRDKYRAEVAAEVARENGTGSRKLLMSF